MSRLNYLCLFIASTPEESYHFFTEMYKYKWTIQDRPHTFYYIALHPTIQSPHNGIWKWQDGVVEGHLFSSCEETWDSILRACLYYLLNTLPFDGFIYSGYSDGVHIGHLNHNSSAVFQWCDIISLFQECALTFPVMILQSCYMGSLVSLLECERITPWVIADPGYSYWKSLTRTCAFWKRSRTIGTWLQASVIEYVKQYNSHNYHCYMVFDMRVLLPLIHEMKQTNPFTWAWITSDTTYDTFSFDLLFLLERTKNPTRYDEKMIRLIHRMMRFSPTYVYKKGPSIQVTHTD
jgi:hypothetical protein